MLREKKKKRRRIKGEGENYCNSEDVRTDSKGKWTRELKENRSGWNKRKGKTVTVTSLVTSAAKRGECPWEAPNFGGSA